MNAIEVKGLKKYYNRGKVKAVDGISFEVPEGSRFGFLGPNGAGKTTTIRCLLGLLNIDEGEIKILGEKINPKKDIEIRNRIGYLPGELGLYTKMTARELINYFSKLYSVEIDRTFINETVQRLQIEMDRKIGDLSKGNKQKIGVLIGLLGKFDLLIMDEPTSGLDPLMQIEFYNIVSERQKESNCTIFLCSHVLPEVEKFCDQVAIIKKGKISEISRIQDLKAKSLKRLEIDFETEASQKEFHSYLTRTFSDATIQHQYPTQLTFLLPQDSTRKILHDLSEKQWAGAPIRDLTIQHSSLENIFLQYYKNNNGGYDK